MIITEPLCIEIAEPCCSGEPVYLSWYNSIGGWETWQFGCQRIETLNVESGKVFERYFQDLATQNEKGIILSKEAQITWTVADEKLPLEYVPALSELLYSPLVMAWVDGQYTRVNIKKDSQVVRNLVSKFINFSFEIIFPSLSVCSN